MPSRLSRVIHALSSPVNASSTLTKVSRVYPSGKVSALIGAPSGVSNQLVVFGLLEASATHTDPEFAESRWWLVDQVTSSSSAPTTLSGEATERTRGPVATAARAKSAPPTMAGATSPSARSVGMRPCATVPSMTG